MDAQHILAHILYHRNYDLEIRQQPERAKVSLINERGTTIKFFHRHHRPN